MAAPHFFSIISMDHLLGAHGIFLRGLKKKQYICSAFAFKSFAAPIRQVRWTSCPQACITPSFTLL